LIPLEVFIPTHSRLHDKNRQPSRLFILFICVHPVYLWLKIFQIEKPNPHPMTKIAILSDIHANLPALEAVLREVEQSEAGRIAISLTGPESPSGSLRARFSASQNARTRTT